MRAPKAKFRLRDLYRFEGFKFFESWVDDGDISVELKRTRKTGICANCGKRCNHVHARRKRWIRDLSLCDVKVFIEIEVFQLDCDCGHMGVEDLGFVDVNSRFTKRFERKVVILCTKMCIKDVAREMKIDWKSAKEIDKRNARKYVIGLDQANPTRIGVDEIAYEKGHKYLTVVRDVDADAVIWVGEGRKKETLDKFFDELGIEKSWNIKAATCDMWDAYISSIRSHTDAAIVFDKFHVVKAINEAVDKVRKTEFAKADKEERKEMKHKRFLILSRQKRLDDSKRETLKDLLNVNQTLSSAYILKEQLCDIFDEKHEKRAAKRLYQWMKNVEESAIEPLQKVLKTIKNYLYGILNYFIYRITNAASEGFNNKINVIKRRAYGFRDLEYFKLKILQICGLCGH